MTCAHTPDRISARYFTRTPNAVVGAEFGVNETLGLPMARRGPRAAPRATSTPRTPRTMVQPMTIYRSTSTDQNGKASVDCPHPDCGGRIKIAPDLPDGDYPCVCHHITVTLRRQPDGHPHLSQTIEGASRD